MEDNEFDTMINAELFDKDLDELAWEPESIEDDFDESQTIYGY